jgi:NADPH:quinone reductase-like Zn-dependent oxidoreductase
LYELSGVVAEHERGQLLELARLADAGELGPSIDSTYSLEHAQEAFDRVAERASAARSSRCRRHLEA